MPIDKERSAYNEAGLQIYRLNEEWQLCNKYKRDGNLIKLKYTLDNIECELFFDAEREDEDIDENDKKYTYKLAELNSEILKGEEKWRRNGNGRDFYLKLLEKEKLLRKLKEIVGKGGIYKSGDEDEM